MEDYRDLPISELSSSARRVLSLHLNSLVELPTEEGFSADIRGVADLRGFRHIHLENFMRKDDPTAAMLREWNSAGLGQAGGTSVQTLLDILKRLDRRDILKALKPGLRLSLENYSRNRDWQDRISEQTTQVALVSSSAGPKVTEPVVDESRYLSIHDTVEQKVYFDVFLSCSGRGSDLEFAQFLADNLEKKHNISCFLTVRDGLAAGSKHTIHAKLIQERCRKFVVLISHEFLKSPEGEFQVRFAQYLSPGAHSKKIIPITIEKGAQKPDILKPISGLDWTREDLKPYFWTRLIKTIQADSPVLGSDRPEMDRLSLVVTDADCWVDDPSREKR